MGRLAGSALEIRLAATLFLLLLGLADLFGAWQVKNFSAFTPSGVAATVVPAEDDVTAKGGDSSGERPINLAVLNEPRHQINRDLLVQDSHVHIPVYAMTAAFLALIVLGLDLSSRSRVLLVLLAFGAPFLDFAGLWGAHFWSAHGPFWGAAAVSGGFLMGIVYMIVLVLTLKQCWFRRQTQGESHA